MADAKICIIAFILLSSLSVVWFAKENNIYSCICQYLAFHRSFWHYGGMYLITVIPITRASAIDGLSYFSATRFSPGTIVTIPLRRKQVPAFVVRVSDVQKEKTALKTAKYELKKIKKGSERHIVTERFMRAAAQTARYFATTTGSVLNTIIPQAILDTPPNISFKEPKTPAMLPEQYVIQADERERLAHYKSMIREAFAKKTSVFFLLPSTQDSESIVETLGRGIGDYTYVLHSGLTKKKIVELWKKAAAEKHPVLIIGTAQYLGIPRSDISTIIVEREASRAYKVNKRPFLDLRLFAQHVAKEIGAHIVLGDTFLRIETLKQFDEGTYTEKAPLKFRSMSTAETKVVNMKHNKEREEGFILVSDELKERISYTRENSEHLFVFTARRGLAPITVCGDCGATVSCEACGAPQVLHKGSRGNIFLCHRCGHKRDPHMKCGNCGGWKLNTLGIGSQLLEEVISEDFPDMTIFRLDADTATTPKKARDIVKKYLETPGSILIGTEKALLYLDTEVEHTAIASMDTLFSVPDFRITERIFRLLIHIRSRTQQTMLLQTREPHHNVIDCALNGNLTDFYRNELKERKQFFYPPYATLIRITVEGRKDRVAKDTEQIIETFSAYEPYAFPVMLGLGSGKTATHILMKVPSSQWVDDELAQLLRSLPPSHTVMIDPESIIG